MNLTAIATRRDILRATKQFDTIFIDMISRLQMNEIAAYGSAALADNDEDN